LKDVFYVPTIIKKISLSRPDGGTRFTGDIKPKWMFSQRHEDPRQFDYKREKGMDECSPWM
jgi:hypothetical protein